MSKKEAKKILLIDDDEIHLSKVEKILNTKYEIICTKSGEDSLELVHHGFTPNLILLDILMSNMDGWDTYLKLRSISFLEEVPIVFFTSVIDTVEKKHAIEMGAADYITKPFEKDDLIRRIEKVI